MMRTLYRRINKFIPLGAVIIFSLALISGIIYLICALFPIFADKFNMLCAPIRLVLSTITSMFPFSIFEAFLINVPALIIALIYLAVKISKKGTRATVRYLCIILCIPLTYFIFFVWTFASGYHTTPIEDKLQIDTESVTDEDMSLALEELSNELNKLKNEIIYDKTGASELPYSYGEMSKKISSAYEKMANDTSLVKTFSSRVKPIILSEPMAYTHISGVYIAVTGESNVNVAYPDYIIASTATHEMAHQRGIARENEASFVGFLASCYSDDPYIKYSAYLNVYYYLLSDLTKSNPNLAKETYNKLDNDVKNDYYAYVKSFQKYKGSVASKVSESVNDTYLQVNGEKNGTNSYNLVSKLVCAYLTQ